MVDKNFMSEEIIKYCEKLEEIGKALEQHLGADVLYSINDPSSPSISRIDLANFLFRFSLDIRLYKRSDYPQELKELVDTCIIRLEHIYSTQIEPLKNGGNANVINSFISTIMIMRQQLEPNFGYFFGIDSNIDPKKISRQAKVLSKKILIYEPEIEKISEKIYAIDGGIKTVGLLNDKASSLNEIIERLSEDEKNIKSLLDLIKKEKDDFSKSTQIFIENYTSVLNDSNKEFDNINKFINNTKDGIIRLNNDSKSLIAQASEAMKVATTAGLAQSFEARAIELRKTMKWWAALLIVSLAVAVCIIFYKQFSGNDVPTDMNNLNFYYILLRSLNSVISIGGLIWLAWVASKQIGYNFRMAEDYHFKAAAAKAYEGYRREAKNIDKALEKKLFESLTERFHETPLQHVEKRVHGSPASKTTQKIVSAAKRILPFKSDNSPNEPTN